MPCIINNKNNCLLIRVFLFFILFVHYILWLVLLRQAHHDINQTQHDIKAVSLSLEPAEGSKAVPILSFITESRKGLMYFILISAIHIRYIFDTYSIFCSEQSSQ